MIRSIRICKTPALGGKVYECKSCGAKKYVYYSCGNSRCPKCQGIKRFQWQDKLSSKILNCPYQHITFTLPHRLNRLATDNPYQVYNCLMRSAWTSLKQCSLDKENLGAVPGAIMVLHTFGSDLKYHIHVHCLVTFGGMSKEGKWLWPKRNRKIVPYRQMRREFRAVFLEMLSACYADLVRRESFEVLESELKKRSWCVHAAPPTLNSKMIQSYLGRYICRIGLSINRFHYDAVHQQVSLECKDYRYKNKRTGLIPKTTRKMDPLLAIKKIQQHCLPEYFQKCRYYGLHASASYRKNKKLLPRSIRKNSHSIRTVFQIIHAMLGIEQISCAQCGHDKFEVQEIQADHLWIQGWLWLPNNRGSPQVRSTYPQIPRNQLGWNRTVLPKHGHNQLI